MANSELKKRLQKMLNRLSLSSKVTTSDIEDIIWNESNSADFNRLIGMLIKNQKNINQANQIVALLQEAWNTFPHKALDGKSPEQLVKEYNGSETVNDRDKVPANFTKKQKTMSEVFAGEYPQNIQIIKIGKSEWGFEFPQLYHKLTEQYWELKESDSTAREYEKMLKNLLKSVPELFDVANDLAIFYGYNGDMRSAKNVYAISTLLAKSYIPPEFIPGKHHIIWAYLDNRPFLRLLAGFAQFIAETEKQSRAIPLYEEILSFNPNDNQGIRFLLVTAYLRTGQPEKVINLASHYPSESSPDLVMGKVLAFLKLGRIEQAKTYLKKNIKYQMHAITEIIKSSHPQPDDLMEDRVSVGGEDEAWYYWQEQGALWETTSGAKDFLKEFVARK